MYSTVFLFFVWYIPFKYQYTVNSVECFKKKLKKLNFLKRKEVGPKMELPQIMFD